MKKTERSIRDRPQRSKSIPRVKCRRCSMSLDEIKELIELVAAKAVHRVRAVARRLSG